MKTRLSVLDLSPVGGEATQAQAMRETIAVAQAAERLGYDRFWVAEHHNMRSLASASPEILMAALTQATKTIRLGTGVALVPQRNPIYTAKEIATLDWLSDGRIDFGIGVGWNKEEVEACGYGWEDRGPRCDEFLEVMQRLWTEPVVDFHGKWVNFETARLDPKPIQKPHVPIIVGGHTPPAMRRTVRFGAGWYGFSLTPEATQLAVAKLDAAFAKAGKPRPPGFEIIITPPMGMPVDAMRAYADLGVDRLVVNLGSQRADRIDARLAEITPLVKAFA